MKKYAITIVVLLWLGVLALDVLVVGQQRAIDFSRPGTFDSIRIGNFTLQQDTLDNDGLELDGAIHTAIVDGKSGNFCIHEANEPTASNDSTGSRLWVDPNGILQHQKSSGAGGGSKQVIVDDGAGNVGIGTTDPKRQFDFDGANIRTQRYLDSDLNTNLGYETFGASNLSGTHNSAFGRQSLYSIASGSGNSGLGNETLYNVTTGGNNVAIGNLSGKGVVGGSHNISLGYKSGYVVAGGNNNISIGSYSNYVGTGSKNIIIGYNIDLPVDAGSNQLNIGNLIYGTGLDGVDKAVSTGKVGIGVTTPAEKLDVAGNIKLTGNIYPQATDTYTLGTSGSRWNNVYLNKTMNVIDDFYIYDATRSRFSIQADGTYLFSLDSASFAGSKSDGFMVKGNAYPMTDNTYDLGTSSLRWDDVWATNGTIQTSDERLKNIKELPEGIVRAMAKLTPIEYTWKEKDNGKHIGFGAQSVRAVFVEEGLDPDDYWAIQYDKDNDIYSIAYQEFIPAVLSYTQDLENRLVTVIQKQQKQIDELTKRINTLERGKSH